MLKTGSLAMELRMSKEKLATGYCLKSHKWITAVKVKELYQRTRIMKNETASMVL
jgi:hypothetical protein